VRGDPDRPKKTDAKQRQTQKVEGQDVFKKVKRGKKGESEGCVHICERRAVTMLARSIQKKLKSAKKKRQSNGKDKKRGEGRHNSVEGKGEWNITSYTRANKRGWTERKKNSPPPGEREKESMKQKKSTTHNTGTAVINPGETVLLI